MPQSGLDARRAALDLVAAVTGEGRLLSEVQSATLTPLAPPDRARAQRLATESLRWASRSDRVLGPYLRKRPEARTHAMLRIAIWELCSEGAAAHAVVNEAVALLGEQAETRRQAGLANAVLRKIAASRVDWNALPLPALPKWLRKPLVATYGKTAVAEIEAVHAARPPIDLTLHPGAPADLPEMLGGVTLPTGSLRLMNHGQVSDLPGYVDGQWWVQDAAAAVPAQVLAPEKGDRILDLCAAPGGKTLQLAAAGADVTALDISAGRLARVEENLARCSLAARLEVADALTWTPDTQFDAVLLDAPCSATGTIRRHPDLPYAKDATMAHSLLPLQAVLLDRALTFLRPGGRLVYCTCSLLPDEGEAQVEAAIGRHPGITVASQSLVLPGIEADWIGPMGLRLRPNYWSDRGGMDGFFVTRLQKPAETAANP